MSSLYRPLSALDQHHKLLLKKFTMKTPYLLLALALAMFSSTSFGQQLPDRWQNQLPAAVQLPAEVEQTLINLECRPDSVLGYGFTSPTDSLLSSREVYVHYGDTATARYQYQGLDLEFQAYDSTVYDGLGREIFKEFHNYDSDLEEVVLDRHEFYYPRGSTDLLDSSIYHAVDFFSGIMEPQARIVNVYDANNQLLEVQTSNWDQIGSPPAWVVNNKNIYYYAPNDQIDSLEGYAWNGFEFVHSTTTIYTYDSNDSLSMLLTLDVATGMPTQKAEYTYNPVEQSTQINSFAWNPPSSSWIEQGYIRYDYDAQGRLEMLEYAFDFFGSFGAREVYEYLGDSPCRWRTLLYEYLGPGSWEFAGILYYFPVESPPLSVQGAPAVAWSFHPNPASEGIWVQTPPGAEIRISDLHGRLLHQQISPGNTFIALKQLPDQYVVLQIAHQGARDSRLLLISSGSK